MNSLPMTIWCNAKFPESAQRLLEQGIAGHRLIFAASLEQSNLVGGGHDTQARSADILLGQPHPDDILKSNALRWVHLTTAGYTRYDRPDLRDALKARGATLTSSSQVYADPCAQHVLSFMLAGARKLSEAHADQVARRGWPYLALRGRCQILTGQSALIVGFGSIGRRLVELLAPFNMNLTAIRRTPRGDEPVRTEPLSQLDEQLARADHVIDILPASADSQKLFSVDRFVRMKSPAVFYNVGRGSTVDQHALLTALQEQKIAAAYLDVTTPEPLPPDDPLWLAPNCYITPHVAGGQQNEMHRVVEHFVANLARFEKGALLLDRIV